MVIGFLPLAFVVAKSAAPTTQMGSISIRVERAARASQDAFNAISNGNKRVVIREEDGIRIQLHLIEYE